MKKIYYQDALRNRAEKLYSDDNANFYEIKGVDLTTLFWKQMKHYFENGKKVSINANGETSDGKSTLIAEIVRTVNEEHLNKKMSEKYIVGNQQEYAQWIRTHPEETNLMLQIDEWSILATTGENSTTETAWLEEVSNIHAQTYIHTASCSPKEQGDKNAFLNFEVASAKNGYTQAYLYYNLYIEGIQHKQIIGHVNINVNKTLKSKWYKNYREHKFKRIDLLRKEGIDKERELIYAGLKLVIIKELQFMAKYGKYSEAMIKNMVTQKAIEEKIPLSMIGKKTLADEIKQVLDMNKHVSGINKEISKLVRKKEKTGRLILEEQEMLLDLQDAKQSYNEQINKNMAWLAKLRKLYLEYKEL